MSPELLENPYFYGLQDDEIQKRLEKFRQEEIFLMVDDKVGVVVANIPTRNLSAHGSTADEALQRLAKKYIMQKL